MAAKSRKKKLLLSSAAVIAAAALGTGLWLGTRDGGDEVNVYPFEYIGMTEFWGDTQESYGPVTTDKIQTEFLTDTQTITKVAVKNGDQVKQGDILYSFDTTLDALSLERKRLEVEKVKVQIKAAEERLAEVRKLEPYFPAPEKAPDKESLGDKWKESDMISENPVYDGSKKELAMICWLKEDMAISDDILQELYEKYLDFQNQAPDDQEQPEKETSSASDVPQPLSEDQNSGTGQDGEETYKVPGYFTCNDITVKPDDMIVGKDGYLIKNSYTYEDKTYWLETATPVNENALMEGLKIPAYPQEQSDQAAWEALWKDGVKVNYIRELSVEGSQLENDSVISIDEDKNVELIVDEDAVLIFWSEMINPPEGTEMELTVVPEEGILSVSYEEGFLILSGEPEEITDQAIPYMVTATYKFDDNHGENRMVEEILNFSVSVVPKPLVKAGDFYVVFKVTKDNYLKGTQTIWRGYKVTAYEDGSFAMLPYDATDFKDHTLPEEVKVEIALPEIHPNQMYTEDQLIDMQKQLYKTIKEQKEKLRLAESEYVIMQRELGDGNVYAEIDGKVISLLTEEEAREKKQPMVKVSGGGGFYIEGSVSELEKDSLKIGQEVTVNDWNNGNVYTGEVVSIGDFPVENDNWNGIGNPTVSYYPFKAFVGEEADLEADSHVSISYSTSTAENGIYLDKAFVRTEHGSSYIYVRGADGKLEKRTVQLGKLLWGSYYEILSDLSEEDYLAFPYGKNVKDGAPTVESDISILYSY